MQNQKRQITICFRHLPATVFWLSTLMLLLAITISTPLGAMLTLALFSASMQLAAMWAVLGPAGYLKNSFCSLLGSSAIGLGALFGCYLGTSGMITLIDSVKLASFGPVIWCVAQIPYWAIRLWLNWQISTGSKAHTEKVAIKDLMGHTVFFALSLALLQYGFEHGINYKGVQPDVMVYQFLIPIAIISVTTFILVCLPAIRLLLSPTYSHQSLRIFWSIQAAVTIALFLFVLMLDARSAFLFVITVLGFSVSISILISIHRNNGLVLGGVGKAG